MNQLAINMEDLNSVLKKLIENNKSDFYLFVGGVDDATADDFIFKLRKIKDKQPKCSLILTTYGGDPNAGYRIMRAIKKNYSEIILYVMGSCKSTGTLMALAADEIVMGDFGEFGPLDIQLSKDDELSNISGLNFSQSLMSLNEQLFRSFEESFLSLKRKSNYTITTKTAAEIGSKLAIGLIAPISAHIDPIKLGEVHRAIQIANHYGNRLTDDAELVAKLITDYPSHGFVIDYEEAKEIFSNVRELQGDEIALERLLIKTVRNEGRGNIIAKLEPAEKETNQQETTLEETITTESNHENGQQ